MAGITNFLPSVPGASHTVRVCCLPSRQLRGSWLGGGICIAPDSFDPEWELTLQQMLAWAFEPADEETLRWLIQRGRKDAGEWARRTGVADAAAAMGTGSRGAVVLQEQQQQRGVGGIVLP